MTEEIKCCLTCGKDDSRTGEPCPTRPGCFTPNYNEWEAPGAEKEETGCGACSHWAAVEIGKFCPDCGQPLK